jgi:hypothetical protein
MKKIVLAISLIVSSIFFANAQLSGSAYIITDQNVSIPPGQQCVTLRAGFNGGDVTTNYTVGQIPYAPPLGYD